MDKHKFSWLFNRLKCMSIAEMAYRAVRQSRNIYENYRLKHLSHLPPPAPDIMDTGSWIANQQSIPNQRSCLTAANDILSGRLRVFRIEVDPYRLICNWNRDPKTGTRAPMVFGQKAAFRDDALVGEIKYLWEPNRHLYLVTLAQAYYLSGNKVYIKALKLLIRSWIEQCPYLIGPNWNSSLEAAIRLINWSIVWQMIGGPGSELFSDETGKSFRADWLASIYQHMNFIRGHLSKHSSANNHLIGEAAGLFIGSNTWPYWNRTTDKWRSMGQKILIEEVQKQTHTDGGTCEQAISYQQFVLDFLILSFLSAKSHGITLPQVYRLKMEKMLDFIASIMDAMGNVPMIGDADDGFAVRLSHEPDFCPYRSLLATGAVLFNRRELFRDDQKVDDKTRWLVGEPRETVQHKDRNSGLPKRAFPNSGYYILGDALGTDKEIRCMIDCGPLGYLSIAAHGHADALAMYLSIGGSEFLIDPGTFCYHTQHRWRKYFRGTSAHNTVRIDCSDQSVSGGSFMWVHKARAKKIRFETTQDVETFEGQHDGYRRFGDPVIHYRKVVFRKREKIISIIDTIECTQKHEVERFWHFHEACGVVVKGKSILAENGGSAILLSPGEKTQVDLHRGNDDLPLGWVSRHYDHKVPCYTAVMTNVVNGTSGLHTEIKILT